MNEQEALEYARKTIRCETCLFFGKIIKCNNINFERVLVQIDLEERFLFKKCSEALESTELCNKTISEET